MSEKPQFEFKLRRNVSTEKSNLAIYDKLKSNAHSPFYQMPYTKSFIAAMAIGIKKGAHPKLKEKNPNVYCEAFTDEEKEAYNKYWAPASHEDIGLFWNQAYTNK